MHVCIPRARGLSPDERGNSSIARRTVRRTMHLCATPDLPALSCAHLTALPPTTTTTTSTRAPQTLADPFHVASALSNYCAQVRHAYKRQAILDKPTQRVQFRLCVVPKHSPVCKSQGSSLDVLQAWMGFTQAGPATLYGAINTRPSNEQGHAGDRSIREGGGPRGGGTHILCRQVNNGSLCFGACAPQTPRAFKPMHRRRACALQRENARTPLPYVTPIPHSPSDGCPSCPLNPHRLPQLLSKRAHRPHQHLSPGPRTPAPNSSSPRFARSSRLPAPSRTSLGLPCARRPAAVTTAGSPPV